MSFMKPDCSFPLSQEPPSRPHRDESEFSPQHRIFFVILVLTAHLHLYHLRSGFFP